MQTKTKIIASIGPASASEHVVEQMARLGVSGFRVNFTHGSPDDWEHYVALVRAAERKVGRPLALIGDLRGPSVRLGELDKPLKLRAGETAYIVHKERGEADKREIPLPDGRVFNSIDIGDVIVMSDGRVRMAVVDRKGDKLVVEVLTDAILSSRKALIVQGKDFELPSLSSYDMKCLEFAVRHGFDYIGLSYVRRPSDIEALRDILLRIGADDVKVIAKVETRSAVENLSGIIEAADAILVARGDLGMFFGLEKVPWLQKTIVSKARSRGKPVIVATQLLESMMENPVPTRAEVSDIVNAVQEGVDALMLTGETSIGKYPIEAVEWLKRIVAYAEAQTGPARLKEEPRTALQRFARGVVGLAEYMGATLIAYSMSDELPRGLAAERPGVPVYIGTPSVQLARRLSILWGLTPMPVEAASLEEGVEKLVADLCRKGELSIGSIVLEAFMASPYEQRLALKKIVYFPVEEERGEARQTSQT